MAKKLTYTEADAAFRHALYHFIVTRGHVPKIGELTAALSRSQKTVRSALLRIADLYVLVLQQNTPEMSCLRTTPVLISITPVRTGASAFRPRQRNQ